MSWNECSVMDEGRTLWFAGKPRAELSCGFGISRKTGTRSSIVIRNAVSRAYGPKPPHLPLL
jgi:hypothetical protein